MVSPLTIVKAVLKRDDAAALQQQIAALKREAAEACTEIERLERERALADDYEAACAIDERIKRQRWVVEHADTTLPALELRLGALRAAEQAAALARHKAAIAGFVPQLIKAVEAAAAVQIEAIKLREAAVAELGEQAVTRDIPHLAFMGILLPDLVTMWRHEVERMFAPPTKPAPRAVAPPARPKPAAAKPAAAAAATRRQKRAALRADPASQSDDQSTIVFVKPGIELPNGEQSIIGDKITLATAQARSAARRR